MPNQGDGLQQAFTQDDAEGQRSTEARQDDQAEGLKNRKKVILDKIQHIKLGNTVTYSKGQGEVVSKSGNYVTIYNKDADAYDRVHIGETYIPGDTISMGVMNQLWDQMTMEVRNDLLTKANVSNPEHFRDRTWYELPSELRTVIKTYGDTDHYSEPARGGFAGREPGVTRDDESRSRHDVNQPEHVNKPYDDDKKAPDRAKSDVEHGLYGGVVSTDTPFDAEGDYEEDERDGDRKQLRHEYRNPDGPEEPKTTTNQHEGTHKTNMAAITGDNEHDKDPKHRSTEEEKNKDIKQNPAAIVGRNEEKEDGSVTTGDEGTNNPVHNDKKITHKHNTRYGVRYGVTKEEFDELRRDKT